MIVYKWVIKKETKYYPLINFGIDNYIKNYNLPPYALGEIYNCSRDLCPGRTQRIGYLINRDSPGYHFWNIPINSTLKKWNYFLQRKQQPIINAILECEIQESDIIKMHKNYQGKGTRIIAKAFKIIKEYKGD